MATYKTPGVFVEEIPSLPPSIVPVQTAIPCFIGYTELHDANVPIYDTGSGLLTQPTVPTKVRSMEEYTRIFGGPHADITVELDDQFLPGDDTWHFKLATIPSPCKKHLMYYMLKMYFLNGGGPCYIVSVRDYTTSSPHVGKDQYKDAIKSLETADEVTLVVLTDATHINLTPDYYEVVDDVLAQCAKLKDRFMLIDPKIATDPAGFRSDIGTQNLEYGATYMPNLNTTLRFEYSPSNIEMTIPAGLIADSFDGKTLQDILDAIAAGTPEGLAAQGQMLENLTLQEIYKQVDLAAESQLGNPTFVLPPSGAIAGVYVATDLGRGVWKAPANVSLSGVIEPTHTFAPDELDDLNVDPSGAGKSINAIRTINGRGHMVMGARTLMANSLEWRYVSVRRTFIFAEESIGKAMEAVVFEPNDANTWNTVKTMIENFLNDLWRQGGLQGAKPSQAYFVNVGLGKTMTEQDILEGRLIVEVGMAVVRPAEFVILRFSHKLQVS